MAHTINSERLKQVREIRKLTQPELADRSKVNKQTIYRYENPKFTGAIRAKNLKKVADALGVDVDVLTGAEPIPFELLHAPHAVEEASYQLNVRIDAPIRNAYELVAHRYNISATKIAQLAPLLFSIVVERSFNYRRKKLAAIEQALENYVEAKKAADHMPGLWVDTSELERSIEAERASIETKDLFGENGYDIDRNFDLEVLNPFRSYLVALVENHHDIELADVGPTSTAYRVCRSEATDLASGDQEVAKWILAGEVPIHRMPRGLDSDEARLEWMRANRLSPRPIRERLAEPDLGDPVVMGVALDLDF